MVSLYSQICCKIQNKVTKVKRSPNLVKFKRKRKLFLTPGEREKIWGETGPYSEAYLIFETRILDDEISRIFLEVEVAINPLTFEIVKKHRRQFKNDKRIQDILEYAQYEYDERGYEASLFSAPYEPDLLEVANKVLQEAEESIIRMHKFAMNYFDTNTN